MLGIPGGISMAFGQHQTFYLRQQWLTKGLIETTKDSRFFYNPEHFEILGVGKNMAKSIRYWLTATELVKEERSTQTEIVLTDFGKIVFDKDLYVKNPYTLGLLHYELCTSQSVATTWYWFFNIFNERTFTKETLNEQLNKWVSENLNKKVSANSIKKDIDCLLALYTEKEYINQTPEDVIRSPFEELSLIRKTVGAEIVYMKRAIQSQELPAILYSVLVKYFEKHNVKEISLNELVNGVELWGKVYNLNRDQVIEQLDIVKNKYPITFTRTNHLDVIRIDQVEWLTEIEKIYETEVLD